MDRKIDGWKDKWIERKMERKIDESSYNTINT
jgi:hypothetical protein